MKAQRFTAVRQKQIDSMVRQVRTGRAPAGASRAWDLRRVQEQYKAARDRVRRLARGGVASTEVRAAARLDALSLAAVLREAAR